MSETQQLERVTALRSDKPLSIVVTHEGSEFVKLRALALEAVPILLRPRDYPEAKRQQIAQGFRSILEDHCLDSDSESDFAETEESFDEENGDYEPGECLDWPQWEEEE